MDENTKKYFQSNIKKRQVAVKSVNNYLSELKRHFELSDSEITEIIKIIYSCYKKSISSKKWWNFFD